MSSSFNVTVENNHRLMDLFRRVKLRIEIRYAAGGGKTVESVKERHPSCRNMV